MKNIFIMFFALVILVGFGAENLSKAASHSITTGRIAIVYSYDLDNTLCNVEKDRATYIQKNFPAYKVRTYMMKANEKSKPYQVHNSVEKLKSRLDEFKPDYIITVDGPAFEYYYVPYIAKQKKTNGIFLNVPDYLYAQVSQYHNLKNYEKYLSGSVIKYDLSSIEKEIYKNKKFIQKLLILKSCTSEDNLLAQHILNQTKISSTVKEVDSLEDMKMVLKENPPTEDTLIITTFKSLKYEDKNRAATKTEISEILTTYNSKAIEISFRENFSNEGVGSCLIVKYDMNDTELPINKLLGYKLNKKNQPKVVPINSEVVINPARFNKLIDSL